MSAAAPVTGVLDLDAVRGCRPRSVPFQCAVVRGAFADPDTATALAEQFPEEGFTLSTSEGDGGKRYRTHNLTLAEGGCATAAVTTLTPLWQRLVGSLTDPAYRTLAAETMDVPLDDCTVHLRAVRYETAGWIDPHTDRADKALTQTWYFNRTWSSEWAGALRLLNSPRAEDTLAEIPPLLGTSVLLRPSPNSWHCVTPVAPAAPDRKTLLLHFVRPAREGAS